MNLGEAKKKVLDLLDETLTSSSALKDYLPKMPNYFDTGQKDASLVKPIRKSFRICQYNSINSLGTENEYFDLKTHDNKDIIFSCKGATSFYFEVDDLADVYIEEYINNAWVEKIVIHHNVVGKYSAYKDKFSIADANNTVRIRFSGNYHYHFRNVAMWAIPFSDKTRIPNFGEYSYYEMPTDFYKAEKITQNGRPISNYYWENPHLLRLAYYDDGEFLLQYQAYPSSITENTPDAYEFEVDTEAQEALIYYVAAYCVVTEDQQYYVNFLSEYRGKLTNIDPNGAFGGSGGGGNHNSIRNTLFRGGGKRGI